MADTELTDVELKIALMWEKGNDTVDIAKGFDTAKGRPTITESTIYNMLPIIRAKRRAQGARVR